MTLPNTRSPTPSPPFIFSPPLLDAATDGDFDNLPHVDYDLHPLKVGCLEHYIEPDDNNKRFRVS
jgi:hypothetical protein